MRDRKKYRGCLIGGAAGDALGAPVEFMYENEIFARYGRGGIDAYDLRDGVAEITDDTQMTLFTAAGLLAGVSGRVSGSVSDSCLECIALSYCDWYKTQTRQYPLGKDERHCSWLITLPGLFARRAPGNTCLSAAGAGCRGTIEKPVNNSKGCGGIMRVAPVGLYFDAADSRESADALFSYGDIQRLGAGAAALTHGHELGYLPAALLSHIVSQLAHEPHASIEDAVECSLSVMKSEFPDAKYADALSDLIETAVDLSRADKDDLDAIHQLGEGWVAEETLAISVYCSLKYPNDFDKALCTSVNHNGDSDSTGAVTGNIVGASLGIDGIPEKYINNLELKDVILTLADDLFDYCPVSENHACINRSGERKYGS